MKRVGFLLKVKQEMIPEYTKHHEAVWPEMLDSAKAHRLAQLFHLHAPGWPALRLLRGGR